MQNGYAGKEQLDASAMMTAFINSNVNCKAYMDSQYIYLNNDCGNFLASSIGLANEINFPDTEWIEDAQAMPAEQKQWVRLRTISHTGSTRKAPVVSLFKRLYASNRNIGVLVLNLPVNQMNKICEGCQAYPQQYVARIDQEGTVS